MIGAHAAIIEEPQTSVKDYDQQWAESTLGTLEGFTLRRESVMPSTVLTYLELQAMNVLEDTQDERVCHYLGYLYLTNATRRI